MCRGVFGCLVVLVCCVCWVLCLGVVFVGCVFGGVLGGVLCCVVVGLGCFGCFGVVLVCGFLGCFGVGGVVVGYRGFGHYFQERGFPRSGFLPEKGGVKLCVNDPRRLSDIRSAKVTAVRHLSCWGWRETTVKHLHDLFRDLSVFFYSYQTTFKRHGEELPRFVNLKT